MTLELAYWPQFSDAWILALGSDGRVLYTFGSDSPRWLQVDPTLVRSLVARIAPEFPARSRRVSSIAEDETVFRVGLRRADRVVELASEGERLCDEDLAPAAAVWNEVVQLVGVDCDGMSCAFDCADGLRARLRAATRGDTIAEKMGDSFLPFRVWCTAASCGPALQAASTVDTRQP